MEIDGSTEGGVPRPTYSNAESARIEEGVAQDFARYVKCEQMKIGLNTTGRMQSRIDRAAIRDNTVVGFFEIKTSKKEFRETPSYVTGERKVIALRKFKEIVFVPVYYVVKFGCGTIAAFDVFTQYTRIDVWGRTDRGDALDIEPGASFAWGDLKVVNGGVK